MNLTGSGGSGKSFVLDATKSFCNQFCRAIGKPFNDSVELDLVSAELLIHIPAKNRVCLMNPVRDL